MNSFRTLLSLSLTECYLKDDERLSTLMGVSLCGTKQSVSSLPVLYLG